METASEPPLLWHSSRIEKRPEVSCDCQLSAPMHPPLALELKSQRSRRANLRRKEISRALPKKRCLELSSLNKAGVLSASKFQTPFFGQSRFPGSRDYLAAARGSFVLTRRAETEATVRAGGRDCSVPAARVVVAVCRFRRSRRWVRSSRRRPCGRSSERLGVASALALNAQMI